MNDDGRNIGTVGESPDLHSSPPARTRRLREAGAPGAGVDLVHPGVLDSGGGARGDFGAEARSMKDDGRNIDTALGVLEGEASRQLAPYTGPAPGEWHELRPSSPAEPTYYDKPVLKQPVWIWSIPAYFYVGGVAGAAMTLALAAHWFGGRRLREFEERCRWIGAVGGGIGTALLIHDLGRKSRFLFMLRVFRPTSPMSIGSWTLAAATPLSAGSAMLTFARGPLHRIGWSAGIGAGILGMPLATYTAVLISNTAVPVWQEARRILPLLFGASSMAGLGAVLELMELAPPERRIAGHFATIGRVAELSAAVAMERQVAGVPGLDKPYREGVAGALWTAAKVATLSSLAISLLPGQSRARRITTGVLGTIGAVCLRFAVFHAGRASARDPRAAFRQQRAREAAPSRT
jgi:formate-dependent nitrite reductase membrane component NrfD